MPVTKEDINRLHERIDPLYDAMTKMSVAVERLATIIELMPRPQPRPCEDLKTHLADHKENVKSWKSAIIEKIVGVAAMMIIGLFMYWLGDRKTADVPEPIIEVKQNIKSD